MGVAYQCDVCKETLQGKEYSTTRSSITRDFFNIQLHMKFTQAVINHGTDTSAPIEICKGCVKKFIQMAYDIDFSED